MAPFEHPTVLAEVQVTGLETNWGISWGGAASMRPNHYLEEIFVELRSRYCPSRLRAYSVSVDDDLEDQSGYCDSTLRVIAVGAGLLVSPLELRRTLVHEMRQVGIPNHGSAFLKQLRRVLHILKSPQRFWNLENTSAVPYRARPEHGA